MGCLQSKTVYVSETGEKIFYFRKRGSHFLSYRGKKWICAFCFAIKDGKRYGEFVRTDYRLAKITGKFSMDLSTLEIFEKSVYGGETVNTYRKTE